MTTEGEDRARKLSRLIMTDDDSEQTTLDGDETVEEQLLRLNRTARQRLGMTRGEAHDFFADMDASERRDWIRLFRSVKDLSGLDPHAVVYPAAIAWLMTECGLSADEAQRYEYLEHVLGPEVPCDVVEAAAPPETWDVDRIAQTFETVEGDTLYRVISEDSHSRVWVDGDYGDVYRIEDYEFCDDSGDSPYNLDLDDDDDAPVLVFRDHLHDHHADTVMIVDPDGRKHKARYYQNVIDGRTRYPIDPLEHPDLWEIACAFVKGSYTVRIDGWRSASTGPTGALDFEKVRGGWHSSVDRSEMQEFVNRLQDGEYHGPDGLDFPVVVTFGHTSNVFSTIVNLYAPSDHAHRLRDLIADLNSFGSL